MAMAKSLAVRATGKAEINTHISSQLLEYLSQAQMVLGINSVFVLETIRLIFILL